MKKIFKLASVLCLSLFIIFSAINNISFAAEKSLSNNVIRIDVYKNDDFGGNVGAYWGDFKFKDMGDGSVRLMPTSGGNFIEPSSIADNRHLSATVTFKFTDNNGDVYKERTFMAGHRVKDLSQELSNVKLRYGLDRIQIITKIEGSTKRLAILGDIHNNFDNYNYSNVIRPDRSQSHRFRVERNGLHAEFINQVKIPNGEYVIETSSNSNRVLDINLYNNLPRNIGTNDYRNNSTSQKFTFEYDNDKMAYKIKVRDCFLTWSSTVNNNVIYYENAFNSDHLWYLEKVNGSQYQIVPVINTSKVLNLDADAKNISVEPRRNNDRQRFNIVNSSSNREYSISSKINNNKVLDMNNATSQNNVTIWDNSNSAHQKWILEYNQGKNAYVIKNKLNNNLILAWNRYQGSLNVFAHPFEGKDDHYWILEINNDNYYTLKNYYNHTGYPHYLDIYGSHMSNGTNVQMHPENNSSNQRFTFTR